MGKCSTPASGRSGEDYQLSFTEYATVPSQISHNGFTMRYFSMNNRVLVVTAEFPPRRGIWMLSPHKSLRPTALSKLKQVPLACLYKQAASLRVDGHVVAKEYPAFSTRSFTYEKFSHGNKTRVSLTHVHTSFSLLPLPPGTASSTPRTSPLAYRAKQV